MTLRQWLKWVIVFDLGMSLYEKTRKIIRVIFRHKHNHGLKNNNVDILSKIINISVYKDT